MQYVLYFMYYMQYNICGASKSLFADNIIAYYKQATMIRPRHNILLLHVCNSNHNEAL
jgi:hypothetical protein